jgi:proliferating cell nuclear antigen PCNA
MFLFALDNSTRLLRKIIDVVKEIANDQKIVFEIDDRGLVLQALDMARVCVLSLYLGPTCFTKFETSGLPVQEPVCLSTAMLLKVLKSSAVDSASELEMSWDGRSDRVTVRTPSQQATFELPLFHPGDQSERFELPEPEHRLVFDANVFATTMKDLALFSDTATFETEDGAIEMKVSVANASGMRGCLWLPAKTGTSADGAKATFALSYLTSMVKAAALSETLAIELQRDRPMTMEVALLSGRGYLRMYLAPKVDDGGDDTEGDRDQDED